VQQQLEELRKELQKVGHHITILQKQKMYSIIEDSTETQDERAATHVQVSATFDLTKSLEDKLEKYMQQGDCNLAATKDEIAATRSESAEETAATHALTHELQRKLDGNLSTTRQEIAWSVCSMQ